MFNANLKWQSVRRQLHGLRQQPMSCWKRIPYKFVILVLLVWCVGVNFFSFGYFGTNLNASSKNHVLLTILDDYTVSKSTTAGKPSGTRHRLTMPPRESSFDTAGYVHIGKTGGSTISKLLRNGCNSFLSGPCRSVPHETQVSKLVVRKNKSC